MKQYIRMLTCLFWLVAIGVTSAQSRTVTGNVTDEQGVPLPGATILEQGTANGVTTGFDGNNNNFEEFTKDKMIFFRENGQVLDILIAQLNS